MIPYESPVHSQLTVPYPKMDNRFFQHQTIVYLLIHLLILFTARPVSEQLLCLYKEAFCNQEISLQMLPHKTCFTFNQVGFLSAN